MYMAYDEGVTQKVPSTVPPCEMYTNGILYFQIWLKSLNNFRRNILLIKVFQFEEELIYGTHHFLLPSVSSQ